MQVLIWEVTFWLPWSSAPENPQKISGSLSTFFESSCPKKQKDTKGIFFRLAREEMPRKLTSAASTFCRTSLEGLENTLIIFDLSIKIVRSPSKVFPWLRLEIDSHLSVAQRGWVLLLLTPTFLRCQHLRSWLLGTWSSPSFNVCFCQGLAERNGMKIHRRLVQSLKSQFPYYFLINLIKILSPFAFAKDASAAFCSMIDPWLIQLESQQRAWWCRDATTTTTTTMLLPPRHLLAQELGPEEAKEMRSSDVDSLDSSRFTGRFTQHFDDFDHFVNRSSMRSESCRLQIWLSRHVDCRFG